MACADLVEHLGAERVRRQHAGRVAGVDAGLLDVLHDPADPDVLAVADRVDVDLDRVLEEAVEEDLALRLRAREVVGEHRLVVGELHRAPAEHVARAHEQREADARAGGERLLGRVARARTAAPCRSSRSSSAPKRPRSSARSIASGCVPSSGTPAASRPAASRSGVWPPKETITPSGCSTSTIASTSSSVSGSKYSRSRRVVVGRDGLRVAVDHHRVAAGLAHGHRGVHAAVVELDALADPVRAGAAADEQRAAVRRAAARSRSRTGRRATARRRRAARRAACVPGPTSSSMNSQPAARRGA